MSARRWSKFWWQDWQRDPALRMCSLSARGLWMEMLAIMHDAEPCGHFLVNGKIPSEKQVAAVVGSTEREVRKLIDELENSGVFSRTSDGVVYSRRMVRDKAISNEAAARGKDGGNPLLRRGSVPKERRVRPYRRTDSPEKTQRIINKSGGKCHWCGVALRTSGESGPDFCHIDHLVPVCDGGGNDEDNLVASCASCNHARARKDWNHPSDPYLGVSVGKKSAPNHQEAEAEAEAEIPSLRSGRLAPPLPDQPVDARTRLFAEGKATLSHMTGKSAGQCGALLGRWLKTCGDQCDLLLSVIHDAADQRPAEAVPWIERAIQSRISASPASLTRTERVAAAWANVPDFPGV